MRIAIGTDEVTAMTADLHRHLVGGGHEVVEVEPGASWPSVGHAVGRAVTSGAADVGIVCCWTGTGVSIAANKIGGVRAALCTDAETARGARRWNDANVLAMGLRLTSPTVAMEIVDAFLATQPDGTETANIAAVEPLPDA